LIFILFFFCKQKKKQQQQQKKHQKFTLVLASFIFILAKMMNVFNKLSYYLYIHCYVIYIAVYDHFQLTDNEKVSTKIMKGYGSTEPIDTSSMMEVVANMMFFG